MLGQLKLDQVIYIPTFMPPHKSGLDIIAAKHRLKMIQLAVNGNANFAVSDTEIKRKGKSYTVDTLREIKKRYPKSSLFFICGSDLVNEIPTWKNVDEIYKLAKFVLAKRPPMELRRAVRQRFSDGRPGFGKRLSGRNFLKIGVAQVDISSSLIRQLVCRRRSIRYLTPDSVIDYIEKNKLYR